MENDQNWIQLSRLADILQLANFIMNVAEASNTDIMKELQKQDNDYLEFIVSEIKAIRKQQEEILQAIDELKGNKNVNNH